MSSTSITFLSPTYMVMKLILLFDQTVQHTIWLSPWKRINQVGPTWVDPLTIIWNEEVQLSRVNLTCCMAHDSRLVVLGTRNSQINKSQWKNPTHKTHPLASTHTPSFPALSLSHFIERNRYAWAFYLHPLRPIMNQYPNLFFSEEDVSTATS